MDQRFCLNLQPGYKALQRFACLKRPIRELQILPQVSYLWVKLSVLLEGWHYFLMALFLSRS